MTLALLTEADLTTTISLKRLTGFNDMYNDEQYADPVDVKVHWIDKQERRVGMDGMEFVTQARMLSLEPIKVGDEVIVNEQSYRVSESYQRSFFDEGLQFYDSYLGKPWSGRG